MAGPMRVGRTLAMTVWSFMIDVSLHCLIEPAEADGT